MAHVEKRMIDLSPDVDEDIRRRVASGDYASQNDVVRAALEALDRVAQDRAHKLAAFDEAIARGIADADAGRVMPLEDAFARVRKELGQPPKGAAR